MLRPHSTCFTAEAHISLSWGFSHKALSPSQLLATPDVQLNGHYTFIIVFVVFFFFSLFSLFMYTAAVMVSICLLCKVAPKTQLSEGKLVRGKNHCWSPVYLIFTLKGKFISANVFLKHLSTIRQYFCVVLQQHESRDPQKSNLILSLNSFELLI